MDFWVNFVQYCRNNGRGGNIALRKPSYDDWYDVSVDSPNYHIFFQLVRKKILRIGIYVYRPEYFSKLESKKTEIESLFGASLEWYTSRKKVLQRGFYTLKKGIFIILNSIDQIAVIDEKVTVYDNYIIVEFKSGIESKLMNSEKHLLLFNMSCSIRL